MSALLKNLPVKARSTYIYRVQSSVWRLPNYWPSTPSPPSECVLPPRQRRGVYTLARGWGGGGVNILQDARHWIGLLQYNPSTSKCTWRHRCLSVWGPLHSYDPILPTPHTVSVCTLYSILIHTGKGGELTRERVRGSMLHKAGSKYQHDWLYLQSINSIKHQ